MLDSCLHALTPYHRPQYPNHQRPQKTMGHPYTTALCLSYTAILMCTVQLSPPCPLPLPPASPPPSSVAHKQPPPTAWEQWANDWAKEMCIRRMAEDLEKLTLQHPDEPVGQASTL